MEKFMDNYLKELAKTCGDTKLRIPVKDMVKGFRWLDELMTMHIDLLALISEETRLKKHHRPYLYVREEIEACAEENYMTLERILDEMCGSDFAKSDEDSDDENIPVSISRKDFDTMVDDVLTLADLLDTVCGFRGGDLRLLDKYTKAIPELGKFKTHRSGFYQDCAREAEEILTRWEDMALLLGHQAESGVLCNGKSDSR